MIILNERHCCSSVHQDKSERGKQWIERPLSVTQAICCDGQINGQAKKINVSRMPNLSTGILGTKGSFMSLIKVVLNYAGGFELHDGVSFAEACLMDIVENMTL